jgi:hypothetical protein
MKFQGSQRWGYFHLSNDFFQRAASQGISVEKTDEFKRALALLSQILIVKASCDYARGKINYLGVSPLFDALEEGETIPYYELEGMSAEERKVCSRLEVFEMPPPECPHCDGKGFIKGLEYEVKSFRRSSINPLEYS